MPEEPTSRQDQDVPGESAPAAIGVPALTVWPMILALGLALTALGLIINVVYCVLGLVMAAISGAGWVRDLLPGMGFETQEVAAPERRARPVRPPSRPHEGRPRTLVPQETYPYKAGFLGGLLGGVVMAVLATLFGIFSRHGIWYPVNLLAGVVFPGFSGLSVAQLEQFSGSAFVAAFFIHLLLSLGLGTLYGMLLPMLPRWPLFWGAVVAPLLWTAVIYGLMGVANPALEEHVNWWWFVPSQVAFGVTAGLVVRFSEPRPVRPQVSRPGRSAGGRQVEGHS